MIAAAAGVGIAIASVAALAAAGFVGYAYGTRVIEYERATRAVYEKAHTAVSGKLAAIKVEIEQIKKTGYADVTSAVQRIEKIF